MNSAVGIDLLQVQSFLRIREQEGKKEVFDEVRKKWMHLLPEEWVRQLAVHYLKRMLHYPSNRFSLERKVPKGGRMGRWDLLVLDKEMQPFLLIECKSPRVLISNDTLYQAAVYNRTLKAPFLCLTNGDTTYCMHYNGQMNGYQIIQQLPEYPLSQKPFHESAG